MQSNRPGALTRAFRCLVLITFFTLLGTSGCAVLAESEVGVDQDLAAAFEPLIRASAQPTIHDASRRANGLTEFFLDGTPYKGRPTRIFALYGKPDKPFSSAVLKPGKMPAVVLVHGGGGTAYEPWVRRWNEAGFAAISIAVEGQTDEVVDEYLAGPDRWARHPFGGPPRNGIYLDHAEALQDEWMFHAVYATIQANNFLRGQTDIDADRVGIVGISWGGVITATTIGLDHRFSFAIPTYGSAFLATIRNQYGRFLEDNTEYTDTWEPALRLASYDRPTLWLTGRAESHFLLPAQAASYRAVGGDVAVSIKPAMRHGHGAGWNEPEPYAFAAAVTRTGKPPFVPSETRKTTSGHHVIRYRISDNLKPVSATLHSTTEATVGPNSAWQESGVNFNAIAGAIDVSVAAVPADTTYWFVNLELRDDSSGAVLTASSRLNSDGAR